MCSCPSEELSFASLSFPFLSPLLPLSFFAASCPRRSTNKQTRRLPPLQSTFLPIFGRPNATHASPRWQPSSSLLPFVIWTTTTTNCVCVLLCATNRASERNPSAERRTSCSSVNSFFAQRCAQPAGDAAPASARRPLPKGCAHLSGRNAQISLSNGWAPAAAAAAARRVNQVTGSQRCGQRGALVCAAHSARERLSSSRRRREQLLRRSGANVTNWPRRASRDSRRLWAATDERENVASPARNAALCSAASAARQAKEAGGRRR